ncbi:hypothetical protein V6N13_117248 [Hibiscus sabdariffa]
MGLNKNTVNCCCVSRGHRTLYEYCGGDHEIENMAVLCLERTLSFHKWYFETIGKRTFGFLFEDGCVYFAIADEDVENHGLSPSPSNANAQLEAAGSTKAPLLRKPSKQEKMNKDHLIAAEDSELEEHRKSTDRGVKIDSTAADSINQNRASSLITLQKNLVSTRIRPGYEHP